MYKSTIPTWQLTVPSIFKITAIGSALVALGLMAGCSSTQTSKSPSKSKQLGGGYLDADSLNSLEDLLSATDMRAVEGDRLLILKHGDVWKRMSVGFKMDTDVWNPRIDAQRGWFISRQPYIDRLSARASRYLYHTVKEAERRGIPTELALLPIIESSYDPAATSSAAAAGLWQFIPSTGRIYGLKQTNSYDGRRDVVESTRAAYEFLGSLYNQFGSWELALAAYNAGPGRIQQAINRNKAAGLPTDYWSLKLPQETMYYVPRFIAVAQIVKDPKAYGVSLPPIANRPHFREVVVGTVSLADISAATGLSRAELYALNPGYRGDFVETGSPQRILIPADLSPTIDAKLKKLQNQAYSNSTTLTTSVNVGVNQTLPALTSTTTTLVINKEPPPALQTNAKTKPVISSQTSVVKTEVQTVNNAQNKGTTPKGSDALALFANQADVPSAPRIPVAVTPAANVKPVTVEPPITAAERAQILATLKAENSTQKVDAILDPVASKEEQDQVVAELTKIAPKGTEIVDPTQGKIKLTAIQTSLSIAEQEGKEVTKAFAYPKSVADNTPVDSDEVKRNSGKNVIRTDSDVVVVTPKGKRSSYRVVAGDTLATIAMKNGLSWRDIANWNQIDPNSPLYVGTVIYLYDAKPVVSEKAPTKPESYDVQPNDSLSSVAAKFGLSLKQLADYNNLETTSNLFVGQKLSLKDNPKTQKENSAKSTVTSVESKIKTKSYSVKRGEYLKLIADRYGLSNQELADLTPNLEVTSTLMVGQKINVPLKEIASTEVIDKPQPATAQAKKPTYKVENYTVQRGDTLSSIASEVKISLAELTDLNDLSVNKGLMVGQTLKVPAGNKTPEIYTVQSGDNLSAIASKYNLTLDYLADLNEISRMSNLRVGQKLKLTGDVAKAKVDVANTKADKTQVESVKKSKSTKVSTESYSVKSGESLNSIASRVGMSVAELAELNDMSARAGLQVGQRIQIPKLFSEYTVKRGDTLIGLANRYKTDTKTLAALNDMQPNAALRLGEVLKVPNL